jgi:hypothetical protein
MKYPLALLCAATLLSSTAPVFAGEIPAPPRKPPYTKVSASASESAALQSTKAIVADIPQPEERARQSAETSAPVGPDEFVVTRKDDLMLSCKELRKEVAVMGSIISDTQNVKDVSKMQSRGISAAGAVGSFLVGTVTGGIGLAVGGLMLDHNVSENKDNADEIQDIAEQRRTWIKGLYTAQACEGPIETPEQEKALKNVNAHTQLEKLAKIEAASGKEDKKEPVPYEAELNSPYNN